MYPLVRLAAVLLGAKRRGKLGFDEPSELQMIVRPWDCDMFFEVNNGRHLTLFDLGRFDFGIRVGLITQLRKNGWGLVVGGATIRYRQRLRPFQRFTLRTRLVAWDERWFYFVQTTLRHGTPCSSGMIRAAVTEGGSVLPTSRVAEALGVTGPSPQPPEWIAAWIAGDALRPWPPEE